METATVKTYTTKEANEKITPHMRVKEFACKDGSAIIFVDNYMVQILEMVRTKIGKPIIITSGYRTPAHNAKVGGAEYSYHMRGMAVDIRVDGVTPQKLAKVIDNIVPDACGIIVYNNWVHFDTRDKKYRKGV